MTVPQDALIAGHAAGNRICVRGTSVLDFPRHCCTVTISNLCRDSPGHLNFTTPWTCTEQSRFALFESPRSVEAPRPRRQPGRLLTHRLLGNVVLPLNRACQTWTWHPFSFRNEPLNSNFCIDGQFIKPKGTILMFFAPYWKKLSEADKKNSNYKRNVFKKYW